LLVVRESSSKHPMNKKLPTAQASKCGIGSIRAAPSTAMATVLTENTYVRTARSIDIKSGGKPTDQASAPALRFRVEQAFDKVDGSGQPL
jgi:hypothetical protein